MSENLSAFVKTAIKNGKIKPVEEAFLEYPVEDEIHQGDPDFFLHEKVEDYYKYSIGDIVFVKEYKYSNGSIGTNHLFVIIEQYNLAVPIEFLSMLISSNLSKIDYPTNKLLEKDNQNNLKKDSIIKTDVVYRILEKQILFKIGSVDIDKVEEYKKLYLKNI